MRPDQIFAILDQSPLLYDINSDGAVAPVDLLRIVDQPVRETAPLEPFVEVKTVDAEGRRRIRSSRPPESIAGLFDAAGTAFAAEELSLARALYAKAVELEPNYFKTYTYLGNTLFFLGDLAGAEEALSRALALNPADYQALLFLGDTYYQLREHTRAKAVLTRAFMLNRSNPVISERLHAVLVKLNLRIRGERLAPEVNIRQDGERVTMRFDRTTGLRWLALAACVACWTYEAKCRDRADEEADPLRLGMYRECLINQAASIAVRKDQAEGSDIGSDEAALLSAIEDGYLEAIIFWEVIAIRAPLVILLLPGAVQEQIIQYIDRYVYVSTLVI